MEKKILSSCLFDRKNYVEIAPYLDESDFSDQGWIIYSLITAYYEKDVNANAVDQDILQSRIKREYPKHAKKFITILNNLEVSSFPNLLTELIKFKKHTTSLKLSNALINGNDSDIQELIDEYTSLAQGEITTDITDDDELFYQTDIATYLEEHQEKAERIPLYPKSLNKAIRGGVLPGQHIVIYATPETGKSLIAINMACGQLRKGYKILYYSNEETAYSLLIRFLANLSNHETEWVEAHPIKAEKIAKSKGYDNLIIKGASPGTSNEICGLIEKYNPAIVYIDQVRLLEIKGQEIGSVMHIETAANLMRTIGKKYGVAMVSVTQAGDSAYNKLVLEQPDTYMSNTGVPGSADLMIGIGMNDAFEYENKRMISLPKNKINSNHGYFAVEVDIQKNKVMSL